MKELSIEEKAQRYDEAIKRAKGVIEQNSLMEYLKKGIEYILPELKESEDEKIRKELVDFIYDKTDTYELREKSNSWLAWLEKQGQKPEKVSIWKHWKNGIAGNGEGKLIYLVKLGGTYRLTSSLAFECDYIELSELDKLMQEEKQGEQKPAAWSEDDEEMLRSIIATCELAEQDRDSSPARHLLEMQINWLKSLRPQNHNKWHSIDEKPVYPCNILYKAPNGNIFLFKYMEDGKPAGPETSYLHSFDDGEWMYLKDIESQSHWKPSDEQMTALEAMLTVSPQSPAITSALIELYQDLKKLKS